MALLRWPSPSAWREAISADIPSFLQDHANNERKASATALSFMCRYPQHSELAVAMADLALEELEHFRAVFAHMHARNIPLGKDLPDPYLKDLRRWMRDAPDARFLDQLLVAAVVEARGCERFGIAAEAMAMQSEETLAVFYKELMRSEAQHWALFLRLARVYFPRTQVDPRLDHLLDHEAEVAQKLQIRAALH